nr:UDP-glycosyltransferase [Nicotiana tabacum]
MDSSKLKQDEVAIVMVPFPGQGHLNQLLQLAYLISSSYNLPIYYVGSATHNRQARVRANALNPLDIAKIQFHDIPTPEFASPPPDFNSLNKFPAHLEPSWAAYEIRERGASQSLYMDIRSGDIHNTSRVIEGKFLDLLVEVTSTQNKKQWAIGPVLPAKLDHVSNTNNICLEWLNKQPPRSVLYISFGTTTSFSDREIKELAMGLEQSKQRFIWVLRDADRGDIFTGEARKVELPEGFEERVKEVGLVVREWAPQLEILAHSSTGGFMSHCGWNSCIESITMGVPIAAWPMHSDQPINGFLVMEILKIGLIVREWEKREELVSASTIENVVRKLMASEEGDEIRKRADELGEAVRLSTEKRGASRMELDSFIAHITR